MDVAYDHWAETCTGSAENTPHPDILLLQFIGGVLQLNRLEVAMQLCQEWTSRFMQTTFRAFRVIDGRLVLFARSSTSIS